MALSSIYKNEVRHSNLFSTFVEEHLNRCFETARILPKRAGERICHQGEETQYFFIVRTGSAKQYLTAASGQEKTFRVVSPGSAIGEIEMFTNASSYACESEMVENGELFLFSMDTYMEILQKNSIYALPLLEALSERISCQTEDIGNLSLNGAHERLSHYLYSTLECKEKSECDPDKNGCPNQERCSLTLPTSKSIIASLLSIQRETFSRTLKKMKEQELIEVEKNQINILDLKKLRESLS